jgi:phage gpG-like protein
MESGIVGGENLIAKLNLVPIQLRKRIEQAVIVSAGIVEQSAKQNIRDNGSVVTGNLFQSVGTVMTQEEDEISATVGTAAKYAAAYEFGQSASEGDFHSVEFAQNILDWVRMKGIDRDWGVSTEEAASAIVHHIQEYGTQPHPFLMPAYQAHQKDIAQLLTNACKMSGEVGGAE